MRSKPPVILTALIVLSAALAVLLLPATRAQAQLPDFSFEDDPRLGKAMDTANNFHPEKAITMLYKIIQDEPGTQVAGAAKLQIAEIQVVLGKAQEARRLINEVAAEFKDTPIGILAAMSVIDAEPPGSFEEWQSRKNQLLEHIGGVPVDEVLKTMSSAGSGAIRFREVPFLNPSAQMVLLNEMYLESAVAFKALASRPKGDLYEYDMEAAEPLVRMCVFLREKFPFSRSEDAEAFPISTIRDIYFANAGIWDRPSFPNDESPPRIRPIAPHDGLTIGSARPKIEVELDDGDIREAQIWMSSLVFTLDGQDLKKSMTIRTHINRSAQFNVVFERMRLIARPRVPLQPGLHTVVIKVADWADNRAEATWSFTTAHGAPDNDPEVGP